jgi:acid phosphatase (class A)
MTALRPVCPAALLCLVSLACPTLAAENIAPTQMLGSVAAAPSPAPALIRNDATFAPEKLIPGPPAPGSPAEKSDLHGVLKLQAKRSPEDCARAKASLRPSLATLYGAPHGPLSAAEIEKLSPLFVRILDDVRPFIGRAKDKWNRPRPSVANPEVQLCVEPESSSSYPSGHAVLSVVYAEALAKIFPRRAAAIRARSRQIDEDRVRIGLHFPSDVRDGEVIGKKLFAMLQASAPFRASLQGLGAKP